VQRGPFFWCVCIALGASGCAPGEQRMVAGDGRQYLPGVLRVSSPGWDLAELDSDAERTQALEEDFLCRLEESNATGGYLVVHKDGSTLIEQGLGVVEPDGAEVTAETLFLQASVSKVFLALATLSLAEEGTLDLDAPLDRYVSGAPSAITPRWALSHRAGVPDISGCPEEAETPSDWALLHAADPLWSPPGVLFNYSNGGFTLVGAALEEVEAARLPEVVRERVFEPAGAATATYALSGGDVPRALGQHPSGPMPLDVKCGLLEAAGGAWASATDLSALLRALLAETDAFSDSLLAELQTLQTSVSGGGRVSYGHGVFLEQYSGELVVYHPGGLPWFGAGLLYIPSRRFGVAYAANSGDFMPLLHDAVSLYFGPELERTERQADLSRMDDYVGTWRDETGQLGELRIGIDGAEITLTPVGERDVWPLPVDGTFWPDAGGTMRYFATRLGVAVKQEEPEMGR